MVVRQWFGNAELAASAERLLGRAHTTAAIAVVGQSGSTSAITGASNEADFEIGSISKAITGMLYRQCIERGTVKSTTELGELLPLAGHGPVERLTLESLAIHRSGLPRLPPGMHGLRRTWRLWTAGENPYGDSLAELLEQARDLKLGPARALYSNLGFELLGHAIAGAEQTSYVDLLRHSFGSGFWAPRSESELRSSSLVGLSRFGRARAAWVGEAIAPAGGIRATIASMGELLERVLDGTAPGVSALEPTNDFASGVRIGAGWITLGQGDRSITWHNGGTGGFRSWIGVDRAAGVGAAVLSARAASVDSVGFRLMGELTGR